MLTRLAFRPTFWPTVFTVPAVLFMVALSVWQVGRLGEKTALIAERQSRLHASPVELPPLGVDPRDMEFRRVTVEGIFLHDRELLLGARSMNGNVGYQVVTPLALEGGGTVLVNRGWIPFEAKDPTKRQAGQVAGKTSIEGVIRLTQLRAWMQPENEPDKGHWFFMDLAAMKSALGLNIRTDLYVEAGSDKNPGGLPIGGQTKINLPNDHLQYAITWALLAVALLVIYVVYHVKLQRERASQR